VEDEPEESSDGCLCEMEEAGSSSSAAVPLA
jgi:hypothetical protein